MCYVKPLRKVYARSRKNTHPWDGETNVQLVAQDGSLYSFHIQEVISGNYNTKVFVSQLDPKPVIGASECDATLQKKLEAQKQFAESQQESFNSQLADVKTKLQAMVDPADFVSSLDDDYRIPRKLRGEPFYIRRIYTRGNWTYIKSDASLRPTFYEQEGKAARVVNFHDENGVYLVYGRVDRGCFKLDKAHACFRRSK